MTIYEALHLPIGLQLEVGLEVPKGLRHLGIHSQRPTTQGALKGSWRGLLRRNFLRVQLFERRRCGVWAENSSRLCTVYVYLDALPILY